MRFRRKLLILYSVFLVGLGVVWVRIIQLQTLEGARWEEAARGLRQRVERLQAPRGPIVDRSGAVLAEDERVFQLALSPWEWKRRFRLRCDRCGVVHFYDPDGYKPRRCACERHLRKAGLLASTSGSNLEPLPLGDLRPLERALDVPPGTLARAAAKRLAEIRTLITQLEAELGKGPLSEFQIGDRIDRREDLLLRRPYVLYTGIPETAVRLVHLAEQGEYRGFRIQTALRRQHPHGDFAPQMIGFTSKVRDRKEYESLFELQPGQISLNSAVGRSGLERAYHWQLAGTVGWRTLERDRDGFFTEVVSETAPRRGKTLKLSVDLEVSRFAESRLEAHGPAAGYYPRTRPSGAFVMLDAVTGQVLVWSEMPRFDLDADLGQVFGRVWNDAVVDEAQRRFVPRSPLPPGIDRAIWDRQLVQPAPVGRSRVAGVAVEPGSTLKPLIALAALHSGRPLPFGSFHCGHLRRGPGCHHCGTVGLERAIAKSCNQFFAALIRYNPAAFLVYRETIPVFMEALGFGSRPGSEVREWEAGTWLRDWTDFSVPEVIADAVEQVNEAHPQARLEVAVAPGGTRRTLGGNRALLTRVFQDLLLQIWRESGSRRVGISTTLLEDRGSEIDVRFDLRPLAAGGSWHLPLTHDVAAFDALPATLKRVGRRVSAMAGKLRFEGSFARRGKVWFTARFDAKIGRTHADEPRRIRSSDGYNLGIGQGPVLVTPLQMARAMAAIANGGRLVSPQVAWKLDGQKLPTVPAKDLAWEPRLVERVKTGMLGAVRDGTARNAGFGRVPARVYGKTGTAQVGAAWRPFSLPEQDADTWHHWFVGFAEGPGGNPVAFACVLHSRTEAAAGETAAKAVADILGFWYGRRPASHSGKPK